MTPIEIQQAIKRALITGKFEYTSSKSIRIILLSDEPDKPDRTIEVEWKVIER